MLFRSACKSGRPDSQKVDLTSVPLATIIQNAQEEGIIESVGMPANWANWGASWFALDHKYGIKHNDIDLSSAEEISTFEVERYSPTKDIGDVGYSFGKIVVEKDLVQAYKASVWESIPSWAKDPQGRWVVSYTGTISIGYSFIISICIIIVAYFKSTFRTFIEDRKSVV